MAKLTTQLLIKISPELDVQIDEAFKKHLKKTGEYITKSEFLRRIIEGGCGGK